MRTQSAQMLELIARGPIASGAIAGEFHLTPAAVSQHLKALREAVGAGHGRRSTADLQPRPDGLAEVDAWIGKVRRSGGGLDALEAALAQEEGEE